jgi:hypothetical protein
MERNEAGLDPNHSPHRVFMLPVPRKGLCCCQALVLRLRTYRKMP